MSQNSTPTPAIPSVEDIVRTSVPNVPNVPGPRGVRGIFGSILGGIGNIILPGLGTVIGSAIGGSAIGATLPGLGGETAQFLALQRQIQQETLAFETASAVQKARHDAALHAIQNIG
jgi:hypothetical protein